MELRGIEKLFEQKTKKWKTSDDVAFCRRGRVLAAHARAAGSTWKSPYSIDPISLSISTEEASVSATVRSSIYPDIKFQLDVVILEDGVVRVCMDEAGGLRKRYDEAAKWALAREPKVKKDAKWMIGKEDIRATYGENEVIVHLEPLKIALWRNGKEEIILNGKGLLHMEHFRKKEDTKENPAAWFEGDPDGWWEERWKTWTDSKPKGPESLSMDISFPNHGHLYGIPEHASSLDLPTTTGDSPYYSEPYRFMNADHSNYLSDSPESLYGSIPLIYAHSSSGSTVGVFHVVGSETWVDVSHPSSSSSNTHWISESGILDTFLLPGPTPSDVAAQYARLTGTPVLPAHWALGYHQCRWNYESSDDIRSVAKRMDEADMPFDALWLDIEYSEEHKYFIWDKEAFPDPVGMIKNVEDMGRHMVIIIDPHLQRAASYPVYSEAKDLDVLIKKPDGSTEYDGWCWSGSCAWVDFFHPKCSSWWKKLLKTTEQAEGFSWLESTDSVGIWNDMNEPSAFDGPEVTMQRDSIHYGGWEHRDVHNIYGALFPRQTWEALYERSIPPKRPFILTRAFFAGSQRYGATWTGDNSATWEHMEVGLKMILSLGICGMSFAGADVGGFFGNPDPELLVRWYQLGAFFPFFRAHAHRDTKRREPYLLDEPYKSIVRDVLKLRYKLLPVWYTAFRETSVSGVPVLRPQFFMFPGDESGVGLDDQCYVGSSGLLVKPVTRKGATETSIYLSDAQPYYDFFSNTLYRGGQHTLTLPVDLSTLPLFIHGGSVIPTRERPRRSSPFMSKDPFILRVALDNAGRARGELYLDDGEGYGHEMGEVVWREFTATPEGRKALRLKSTDLVKGNEDRTVDGVDLSSSSLTPYSSSNTFAQSLQSVKVERILVLGLSSKPSSVETAEGGELEWEFEGGVGAGGGEKEGKASILTVQSPGVGIVEDWEIVIE